MDGNVYCLNAATGAQVRNYTTGGPVGSSPSIADGKVYVGSFDGKAYCLNATDGMLIWAFTTDGILYSSPVIAYGVAYVVSADCRVYAIGTEVIPEGLTIGFMLLLSTVTVIVSLRYFRKRSKVEKFS